MVLCLEALPPADPNAAKPLPESMSQGSTGVGNPAEDESLAGSIDDGVIFAENLVLDDMEAENLVLDDSDFGSGMEAAEETGPPLAKKVLDICGLRDDADLDVCDDLVGVQQEEEEEEYTGPGHLRPLLQAEGISSKIAATPTGINLVLDIADLRDDDDLEAEGDYARPLLQVQETMRETMTAISMSSAETLPQPAPGSPPGRRGSTETPPQPAPGSPTGRRGGGGGAAAAGGGVEAGPSRPGRRNLSSRRRPKTMDLDKNLEPDSVSFGNAEVSSRRCSNEDTPGPRSPSPSGRMASKRRPQSFHGSRIKATPTEPMVRPSVSHTPSRRRGKQAHVMQREKTEEQMFAEMDEIMTNKGSRAHFMKRMFEKYGEMPADPDNVLAAGEEVAAAASERLPMAIAAASSGHRRQSGEPTPPGRRRQSGGASPSDAASPRSPSAGISFAAQPISFAESPMSFAAPAPGMSFAATAAATAAATDRLPASIAAINSGVASGYRPLSGGAMPSLAEATSFASADASKERAFRWFDNGRITCSSLQTDEKQCRLCQVAYSGFGPVCQTCRRIGRRGSVRQCVGCSAYFTGFGDTCCDCIAIP